MCNLPSENEGEAKAVLTQLDQMFNLKFLAYNLHSIQPQTDSNTWVQFPTTAHPTCPRRQWKLITGHHNHRRWRWVSAIFASHSSNCAIFIRYTRYVVDPLKKMTNGLVASTTSNRFANQRNEKPCRGGEKQSDWVNLKIPSPQQTNGWKPLSCPMLLAKVLWSTFSIEFTLLPGHVILARHSDAQNFPTRKIQTIHRKKGRTFSPPQRHNGIKFHALEALVLWDMAMHDRPGVGWWLGSGRQGLWMPPRSSWKPHQLTAMKSWSMTDSPRDQGRSG